LVLFVETALFFITALEGDRFYRIVGLEKALGRPIDPAADNVRMNGTLYQSVETGLQLFAVDGEFPANCLNGMLFIEVFVEVFPDPFDQLDIFTFHVRRRFNASDHQQVLDRKARSNYCCFPAAIIKKP
jgi:hypothetical protein